MNSYNNSIRHILALESGSWKKTFFLDKNTYSIGRNSTNSLVIHHRVISRNHATLMKVSYINLEDKKDCYSIFWLIDGDLKGNKSTNGIYVNGKQCLCHQLQPGDLIFLGGIEVKGKYDIVDLETKSFFSTFPTNKNSFSISENSNVNNHESNVNLPILNKEDIKKFELVSQGILMVDIETQNILIANDIYCNLVNFSSEDIINLKINDLFPYHQEMIQYDLDLINKYNISCTRESINKTKNNVLINTIVNYKPIIFEEKKCLLLSVNDISEFKKVEEVIRFQANHDSVINLPNKKLFIEQLILSLSHNKIKEDSIGIIKLKINHWDKITYLLDVEIENKLLQNLVKYIRNNLSAGDILTKYSNDEYIIMLEEVKNNNRINTFIENILSCFNQPLIINHKYFFITINFGISIHPQNGETINELFDKATIALKSSYDKSFNNYQFYHEEILNKITTKDNQEDNIIFNAINNEKFILKYEPIINVNTNDISALNSKIYYKDNQNFQALDILTIASNIGKNKNLLHWWLNTIVKDIKLWKDKSIYFNKITLKIPISYLTNSEIINCLTDEINHNNLDNLTLELIMDNPLVNLIIIEENLAKLVALPLGLTLLDFDFNNVRQISNNKVKFTTIKISESLTQNLENNHQQVYLISSIISLATFLNAKVIAEGIDTHKKRDILKDLGCEEMQGLFFSSPLSAKNMIDFCQGYSLKTIF